MSQALASAVGSGLATTAVTGDLKKGIAAGLTGFGLGKIFSGATDAAAKAANPQDFAALDASQAATDESLKQLGSEISNLNQQGIAIPSPDKIGYTPKELPYWKASEDFTNSQAALGVQKGIADQNIANMGIKGRMMAPFQQPGAMAAGLKNPSAMIPIATGAGQYAQLDQNERLRDLGRGRKRKSQDALERAYGIMSGGYNRGIASYPGVYGKGSRYTGSRYAVGGIVRGYPEGGTIDWAGYLSSNPDVQSYWNENSAALIEGGDPSLSTPEGFAQYHWQTFGQNEPGRASPYNTATAANEVGNAAIQEGLRGANVIPAPEGYRPGFDPEWNFFNANDSWQPIDPLAGYGHWTSGATTPSSGGQAPWQPPDPTGNYADQMSYINNLYGQHGSNPESLRMVYDYLTEQGVDIYDIGQNAYGFSRQDIEDTLNNLGVLNNNSSEYSYQTPWQPGAGYPAYSSTTEATGAGSPGMISGSELSPEVIAQLTQETPGTHWVDGQLHSASAQTLNEMGLREPVPGVDLTTGNTESMFDENYNISSDPYAYADNPADYDPYGLNHGSGYLNDGSESGFTAYYRDPETGEPVAYESAQVSRTDFPEGEEGNYQYLQALIQHEARPEYNALIENPDQMSTDEMESWLQESGLADQGIKAYYDQNDISSEEAANIIDASVQMGLTPDQIAEQVNSSGVFDGTSFSGDDVLDWMQTNYPNKYTHFVQNQATESTAPTWQTQLDRFLGEYQDGTKDEAGSAQQLLDYANFNQIPLADVASYYGSTEDELRRLTGDYGEFQYAQGGQVQPGNQLVDMVIAVITGQIAGPEADQIVERFIAENGQEAFIALREQVLQSMQPGSQTQGLITGAGGGMDDQVPGVTADGQNIAVSPGEYIVPADVVSGLGDGSSEAGSQELDAMLNRVRQMRTGMPEQPQPIEAQQAMPL
jgi:hypothetical protein